MSRWFKRSWSRKSLTRLYCGFFVLFIVSFFVPVIGDPDRDKGVIYGHDAAAFSWELLVGDPFYDDVYKVLVPSQAVRESISDKTMIATFLLYSSRFDEAGLKDPSFSNPLVHVYSICLQVAWLCNAIPILLLLLIVLKLPDGPLRKLLILSSCFLSIIAISLMVLPLFAWSLPIYLSPGSGVGSGYWIWMGSLSMMTPVGMWPRKCWPFCREDETSESAGSA